MRDFATVARPVRCSYLSWIAKCNMKVALDQVDDCDSTGTAAQTGSAVHAGIAAFHLATGSDAERVAVAFDAMRRALPDFPLADADEARLFLAPYVADPNNARATFATVGPEYLNHPAGPGGGHPDGGRVKPGQLAIELPVRFTIPPHPLDLTKQPIVVLGTLDQLRVQNGRTIVCDAKTGAPTGPQMIHDYAYQLAAYTLGARQCGWPTAEPGYLIRLRRYRERTAENPSPVGLTWEMPYTYADCEMLLDQVRLNVALIRSGYVNFGPGVYCTYCPHKGLDGCIPKAKQRLGISVS